MLLPSPLEGVSPFLKPNQGVHFTLEKLKLTPTAS
jgi:hypothetical protein